MPKTVTGKEFLENSKRHLVCMENGLKYEGSKVKGVEFITNSDIVFKLSRPLNFNYGKDTLSFHITDTTKYYKETIKAVHAIFISPEFSNFPNKENFDECV